MICEDNFIDASEQGQGYGKAALGLVLDYIKSKPFGESGRITLTCNKENEIGFELTGNEDEDEVEMAMTI